MFEQNPFDETSAQTLGGSRNYPFSIGGYSDTGSNRLV
jgi:hypothetical protein